MPRGRRPHPFRTCELAVALSVVGPLSLACDPIVIDAFEPPPEPIAMEPITCPPGSLKAEPGACGCELPDDDFDGDGAADCVEACPDNDDATVPSGPCGCSSYPDTNACGQLRAALRNLYTFDGQGTTVVDALNGDDGTVLHVEATPEVPLDTLQRNGRLTLDGSGSYVDLPDGIVSRLSDATFEAWVTWRGGDFWSRIFDFGDNGGTPVNGVTYLFLTPSNADNGTVRVAYSVAGPQQETIADGAASLPIHAAQDHTPDQVAVVVDRTNSVVRLYSNGVEIRSENEVVDLGAIRDVNNWLGRSNYLVDPPLAATLVEFRIYGQALTADQLNASYQAGPGALD
ncbi:MAG TPA: LamG domain-containing protein [Polyangiaceae bacterium]|nr:LamG domain-containing protein [Polyangiaceae bacterium]